MKAKGDFHDLLNNADIYVLKFPDFLLSISVHKHEEVTIVIDVPFIASMHGEKGDDLNNGESVTFAFTSIKTCIDALTNPGDECHIRGGHYHQSE